jgi:MFS family permease
MTRVQQGFGACVPSNLHPPARWKESSRSPNIRRMPKRRDRSSEGTGEQHVTDHAVRLTSRGARAEVHATIFATGAAVMVVEILGTRIIGPAFGVSLFVWAALLAVTLGALAIGYYLGGVLADRRPNRILLGVVVIVAGALLGLTPVIRHGILLAAQGLGPRGGPLLSASLLFGPCLLMLGTVGPIAVRLATDDLSATGHRVGSVYAISTAGSLTGTILTAFFLIPSFDTSRILVGTAAVLAAIGAVPLALRRQRSAALALMILPMMLTIPAATLPPGIKLVARSQSPYGLVEVIDDDNRGIRVLRADHSIIGGYALTDHSPVFAFLYVLEAVRLLRPQAKDLLQIGLGIGSLPMALGRHGIKSDVVEIDPDVVRIARDHFDFSTRGDVFVEDARTFLTRTRQRYDLIVHDTFTGGSTPEHLLSSEVIARIRAILRPGGVLALNFPGYETGSKAGATWAVARTLRAVFPHVRAFRDSAAAANDEIVNIVFFASDLALDLTIPRDVEFENDVARDVLSSLPAWQTLRTVPPGPLITDARNPLARLQLPSADAHFAAMNRLFPPEVWVE